MREGVFSEGEVWSVREVCSVRKGVFSEGAWVCSVRKGVFSEGGVFFVGGCVQ